MAETSFTAGRLVCRRVRNFLDEMKWRGHELDYFEGPGLLERRFVVRGSREAVQIVEDAIVATASE